MSSTFITGLLATDTPLFLAPQAGVSESPFRRLCRRFGADVVVSEFVSAEGILHGNVRSRRYLRFDDEERPIGVQIFGAVPQKMAEAARLVADVYGPDFIDINFGCPVKKVVRRNGGSGCLRDLDLVQTIIRAVDAATELPTTVKIRSGYDDQTRDPVGIALRCQDAGAALLTLHARTRADMYTGSARWDEIGAVTDALEIPVIGNGDVNSGADAVRLKQATGCHGVMIARGSHGAPWIFREARALLSGDPVPAAPDVSERFEVCLEHARNALAFEVDADRALVEFRKHLAWYTRGLANGRELRTRLFEVRSLAAVEELLRAYLEETTPAEVS